MANEISDDWMEASGALVVACREVEKRYTPGALATAYLALAGDALGKLPAEHREQRYLNVSAWVKLVAEERAKAHGQGT